LAADFGRLAEEVHRLEEAGAKILHLDVMDGHFVPNLSFGVPVVEAVRRVTQLPLDVHLMISEPGRYLKAFRQAGADLITIHIEAVPDPRDLLREIRSLGAGAGLSLNPPTPIDTIAPFVNEVDLVLVMSVMPGFGGQKFQAVALEKLHWLREHAPPEVLFSVDGGVNAETIGACARAGAELFVTGTALLGWDNYQTRLAELRSLAQTPNVQV
jgi:ribulose-phosphate 3-epimerase